MNKKTWIFLFALAVVANITGGLLKNHFIDYLSKPFIVISLVAYFLTETHSSQSSLKKWILLALLFSLAGDALLMFQHLDQLFFLLGLSAFLVAHIFYIVFFGKVKSRENISLKVWYLLVVAVYYAILIILLFPGLGDMKLPVLVYGIVISIMLTLALHMRFIKNDMAGHRMMVGAILFIISDSTLAINKFYHEFEIAGIVVMLTYALAQFFITDGAARYIVSDYKE